MKIDVTLAAEKKSRPAPKSKLGFGRIFTDHVFRADYSETLGWHGARVEPYHAFSLDPAAATLHYGQAIFEGLKAFRREGGGVRFFRPEAHARRMQKSAELVCMPPLPVETFLAGLHAVVRADEAWVPNEPGSSLYVRPTMIATEAFLGVRPAHEYVFFTILSPVDAYYAEGFSPLKIWVESELTRACPGGVGAAKTGANYVASLRAAEAAKKRGYAQVLWLDGATHSFVEEVGTMNLFVKIAGEVITPSLESGSILAGITRDSVLKILRDDLGVRATERRLPWDEIAAAGKNGTLEEVFGTGTAAVISPVGELGTATGAVRVGDGGVGPLSRKLYDIITGIQLGTASDTHGFMTDLAG